MSLHATATWTVCYDIADPKRGAAVLKCMKKHGVPVQYSVFRVEASTFGIQRIMFELEGLIDARVDDVRAYRWPARVDIETLGPSLLPEGTLLYGDECA